jgi:hypothetical protein
MAEWKYNHDNYKEGGFELIPVGDHRVRIEAVEDQKSKTGKDMYKFTLSVSGYSSKLFYYLVFDQSNPQMTDQNLGAVYDSFNIPLGTLEPLGFMGKVGAAKVKHEEYKSDTRAAVQYFLSRWKQDKLPQWKEGGGKGNNFTSIRDDDADLDADLGKGSSSTPDELTDCPF